MTSIEPKPINAKFNDEQWQAIQTIGNNILVSASAGSGKTMVLIERIFAHIRRNYASIDELLVVTFTEAAANEMKERMENRLKQAVNETQDSEEQRRLINQINLLQTAHIRTLHSFCLNVIQQFFYLIDFNPNFRLLTDSTEINLMYEKVWQNLVADIYGSKEGSNGITKEVYFELLSRYSQARSDEGLAQIIVELHTFASSHPEPALWLESLADKETELEELMKQPLFQSTINNQILHSSLNAYKLIEEAQNILQTLVEETIEKYDAVLDAEQEQAGRLFESAKTGNIEQLMEAINNIRFSSWKPNRKTSEDYEVVVEIKELREQAKNLISSNVVSLFPYSFEFTNQIEHEIQPVLQQLSRLTLLFEAKLKKYKTEQNIIDYNDLEHLTLDILAPFDAESKQRIPSPAAKYYQNMFKEVLVDEYQDINDIQAAILSFLSHENLENATGNLFMVGDVKQSIYGFRMAEPSIFLDKYQRYQGGEEGELIILDKNYRSRDEVLQFTNFIFERIMSLEFGEMDYGEDEALTTGNHTFLPEAPDSQFDIEFILYEKEHEADSADDDESNPAYIDSAIEAESHLIAQSIRQQVNEEQLIYDKKLEQMRPVKYSDYVILSSTRKPFLIMQRVFEQYKMPIFAQKVENYFQRQEVQLMVALLKIIDNPVQDIPLAAILRSYFVGLNDEALSQIRIQQKSGPFYEAVLQYINNKDNKLDDTIIQKLKQFMQQLLHWQKLSKRVSLVELIWTIYQETDFLEYVSGLSNGTQRQANLHALYERAREFEDSLYKGVFGFIQYIEQVMQQENDLAEPMIIDNDQEFVRMMTVHASKGLEFPMVYIMDTAKRFNLTDARSKSYIASKDYGLGTDLYDYERLLRFESIHKKALQIEKENQFKAEEMRKLYVALTRCEQKLFIVGSISNREKWHEQIQATKKLSNSDEKLVPLLLRQSANSWLDWLQQSVALSISQPNTVASFNINQITFHFRTLDDINQKFHPVYHAMKTETWLDRVSTVVEQTPADISNPLGSYLTRLFNTSYPQQITTQTSSYQSVSELKRLYEEPRIERIAYYSDRTGTADVPAIQGRREGIQGIRYTEDTFEEPKFMQQQSKQLTSAEIGSATHYLLQHLSFAEFEDLNEEEIMQVIEAAVIQLQNENGLTKAQVNVIKYPNIIHFILSSLGQLLIKYSDRLYREQAFSYLIPAATLFGQQLTDIETEQLGEDQLLIHGVIDNYIELDDQLILLDYKTDRYQPYSNLTRTQQIQSIINKYRFQLSLYKVALSQAKNKAVTSANIVLLDFNEVIELRQTELYNFSF